MAVAQINQVRADEIADNIGMIITGETPHTVMAAVSQVITFLALDRKMSFEDMMDDLSTIHDVLYANSLQKAANNVQ